MNTFILIAQIAMVISFAGLTLIASKYYIHMLQLEGYFIGQYTHHLFSRVMHPSKLLHQPPVKKPLVITDRVKRLWVTEGLLVTACAALEGLVFYNALDRVFMLFPVLLVVLNLPLASLWVLVATVVCLPLEKAVAGYYIHDARKKLASRPDLKIIGITGSYGKTSTKFILSTILSEKYAVLTPPSSYNTTLGVVRVIRERLQPDDEVFVCEMGARHLGDIREICDLVHPRYGLITSIGPQHLDTFGSLENIQKGKFELIEALPENGFAAFASSGQPILDLFEKAACRKITAGFRAEDGVRAENVTVGCSGSAFTLVTLQGETECETCLLGQHNINNILAAAAMALELGLTPEQIARGIRKIKPIEHRLQIVAQSPVTIIDDAFNASPNGAKAALDTLSRFTGRKIIVTPGFVELGKDQADYHRQLGEKIASSADVAILVGKKRAEEIQAGMQGFAGKVYPVSGLNEATALLRQIGVAGDVVLFENDLPDNYNE